jgi:hypothetical protein
MIDSIRGDIFLHFTKYMKQIFFCLLSNLHEHSSINNMKTHTIERWKKIQGKLKVVQVFGVYALCPLRDTKDRQIPPIEYWRSMVHKGHVDKNGKHLSISSTTNGIRTQWSTDINVGGINSSFIQDCVNSCEVCQEKKMWDEVVTVPLEDLNASFDELCTKHIVLRRRYKCRVWKTKTVTYYRCHRGGNKERPYRKMSDMKPIDQRKSRRDRTSRLCDCEFQIKVVEPKISRSSSNLVHATIYIHSKHSGHNPGSDADLFFLPVHPHVIVWVMENLKYMHSPRNMEAASERAQDLFSERVTDLERVTYRFFIIKKEVHILAYSLRINGMLIPPMTLFFLLMIVIIILTCVLDRINL